MNIPLLCDAPSDRRLLEAVQVALELCEKGVDPRQAVLAACAGRPASPYLVEELLGQHRERFAKLVALASSRIDSASKAETLTKKGTHA